MPVDEALLDAHSSFRDPLVGISEEFVRFKAGPRGTLGVLSRPLGQGKPLAWVICHSFGGEQVELHMTDVAMARALASRGYPTLRFHCQGYGDSDDVSTPPGPSTQLRDTVDAVGQLRLLTGATDVGLAGSRFGATIAALVAPRVQASHLVMAQPVVSGSKYVTELLRSRVITAMFVDNRPAAVERVEDLRTALETEGMLNVKGWRLYREVHDELRGVDLLKQAEPFAGRALIVQVSRSSTPQGSLTRVAESLGRRGADVRLEVLVHAAAPNFGFEHFRPVEKEVLGDVLDGVNQGLIDLMSGWLDQSPSTAPGEAS